MHSSRFLIAALSLALGACGATTPDYLDEDVASSDAKRRTTASACRAGKATACETLANGIIKSDPPRSLFYYERGCTLGSQRACYGVGWLLERIKPVSAESEKRSDRLVRGACEADVPNACALMGLRYEFGRAGVAKDWRRARRFNHKACALGLAFSCKKLDYLDAVVAVPAWTPEPVRDIVIDEDTTPRSGGCIGWSVEQKSLVCITVELSVPHGYPLTTGHHLTPGGKPRTFALSGVEDDRLTIYPDKDGLQTGLDLGDYKTPRPLLHITVPGLYPIATMPGHVVLVKNGTVLIAKGKKILRRTKVALGKGEALEVKVWDAPGVGIGLWVLHLDEPDGLPLHQSVHLWQGVDGSGPSVH